MSQVLLWFIFPIGFYTYFVIERRNKLVYQKTFDDFALRVSQDSTLNSEEKRTAYRKMLLLNDYTITKDTQHQVSGKRKVFSLGLLMMGFILYVFYFYIFQKPHRVVYEI